MSERRRHRGRKERILHTRVSEELEEDLRRAAEELRVPVSNLVRNVLEEAVTVAEAVSDEFGDWIDDVVEGAEQVAGRFRRGRWTDAARSARARSGAERRSEEARRSSQPDPPESAARPARAARSAGGDVLGWQPLVLDAEQRCECGRVLAAGATAHVALTTTGLVARYRCGECIGQLGRT